MSAWLLVKHQIRPGISKLALFGVECQLLSFYVGIDSSTYPTDSKCSMAGGRGVSWPHYRPEELKPPGGGS